MPLSPDDRRARREATMRRTQRRRRVAVLVATGCALLIVAAVALFSQDDSPSPRAATTTAAATTAPTGTTTAERAPVVPKLPPIAPMRPGEAKVIERGPTKGRRIALTFDDGACAACVAALVRQLERTGMPATFFPNGRYQTSWGPVAKRIRRLIAIGQVTMGNHTFSHGDAVTQSSEAFTADLQRNEQWIQKTFRVSGRPWFRPPFGSFNATTVAAAGTVGYTRVVLWSGTVADSDPRSIPYLVSAVRYWAKPGVIMLMHSNYPNTAKALPAMLRLLKRKHLTPVTLAELMRDA